MHVLYYKKCLQIAHKRNTFESKNCHFVFWLKSHKYKSMGYNKLITVEQHFHWNGYDSYRDAKFTIIERIKKQKQHIGQHYDGNRNTQK